MKFEAVCKKIFLGILILCFFSVSNNSALEKVPLGSLVKADADFTQSEIDGIYDQLDALDEQLGLLDEGVPGYSEGVDGKKNHDGEPFGGLILDKVKCTCLPGEVYWLPINDKVTQSTIFLLDWQPQFTKMYEHYQSGKGRWILGTYTPGPMCWILVGYYCISLKTDGVINKGPGAGVSLGGSTAAGMPSLELLGPSQPGITDVDVTGGFGLPNLGTFNDTFFDTGLINNLTNDTGFMNTTIGN